MKTNSSKGFTLIEILISSAIFAMIMVMVTGIFSMTASYNNKISETRTTLSDARSAMTQISDEVRLSNGSATIIYDAAGHTSAVKDIFLLKIDSGTMAFTGVISQSFYNPLNPTLPGSYGTSDNLFALGIIQRQQNKIILYTPKFNDPNFDLMRLEIDSPPDWNNVKITPSGPNINSTGISLDARFGVYAVTTGKLQPFANVWILSETRNYDLTPATQRYRIELRSSVESRDYN